MQAKLKEADVAMKKTKAEKIIILQKKAYY